MEARIVTRYLLHLFMTPSAYLGSVRGFLTNQAGHWAVGSVLAHVIGWWVMAGYAVWEIAQYQYARHNPALRAQRPALRSDAVGDWAFVASGVLAVLVSPWVLILTAARLTEGVLARLKR